LRCEKKKEASFSGSVKVVQGDTTMTSEKLVVFYESSSAPGAPPLTNTKGAAKTAPLQSVSPGPGGSSSINRMEARGDVRVTQKDQVVTGETAIFDTKTNLITMLGGVVLTQCKSVLRGDRLLVDMTRAFRGSNPMVERVQCLFDQSSGSGCGAPAPALPTSD
jgi:lipopolysaccharide export system protein LptA